MMKVAIDLYFVHRILQSIGLVVVGLGQTGESGAETDIWQILVVKTEQIRIFWGDLKGKCTVL